MEDSTTKVLLQTLQKHGYDLDDDRDSYEEPVGEERRSSLSSGRASTSASILQLRERKNQQTAFHIAVKKGHVDVLKALARLPRIQDHVNAGDRHANTALHFAASSPRECAPEMVESLFAMGADMNIMNIRGQTPLAIHIMTTKNDDPTIVRLFLKHRGIPLNDLVNGTTYLHMAMERTLTEIGGALISSGASINMPDHNGVMVGDIVTKKTLIRLCCFMREGGSQAAPVSVPHNTCKICKNVKGMLETFKECNLCGRVVCKTCSKKSAEIKAMMPKDDSYAVAPKDKDGSRLCTVCCTVVLLRNKQHRAKEHFNEKLYGCGMK